MTPQDPTTIRLTGSAAIDVAHVEQIAGAPIAPGAELTLTVAATITHVVAYGTPGDPRRFVRAHADEITVRAASPTPTPRSRPTRTAATPTGERWRQDRTSIVPVIIPGTVHAPTMLEISYYRGSTREGRHTITIGPRTLDVRPDGATAAHNRSRVINEALRQLATTAPDAPFDPLTYIAGALYLAGATNVEIIQTQEPTR